MTIADWLEVNRANWDDRTAVHAESDFYDLAGFRDGASTLRPFEITELGDVAGRSLLHLQCHMGQDTLSWARLGADVTGLDFSAAAIDTARALADGTGLAPRARFVTADVYSAAQALDGRRFDIVYTGIGALVWLPDLTRWADVVASCLVEGGLLYLVELHPFADVLDDDGRSVTHDYFTKDGEVYDTPATYTDGPPLNHTINVQWQHPLSEVVTALARAGLRLESLREHPMTLFRRFPDLERSPDGGYRFPTGRPRIPLLYSLRASRR